MTEAIDIRYGDADEDPDNLENPIATITAIHVKATGLDAYTADPTEDDPSHVVDNVYYITASVDGDEVGRSQLFTPSVEGDGYWEGGYTLPTDGSFTFAVMKVDPDGESDDEVTTQALTVDPVE